MVLEPFGRLVEIWQGSAPRVSDSVVGG